MKRLGIFVLMVVFAMSMSAAAFAEPAQIASAVLEDAMNANNFVRVTVDLKENWSVRFSPMAFCLYDHPAYSSEDEFFAYGTLISGASYDSLMESIAKNDYEEKDGVIVRQTFDGLTSFLAPVDQDVYITVLVEPDTDADEVWARIACERESYGGELVASRLYTEEDLGKAFEIVLDRFRQWTGCSLYGLRYAGDECNSEENLAWLNELGGEKGFTQCLEVLIDFHTSADPKELGDMVFEPDTDYTDYQWWLARTADSGWEIVSMGY